MKPTKVKSLFQPKAGAKMKMIYIVKDAKGFVRYVGKTANPVRARV